MNVLVAVDAQLFRTPDGKVWCRTIYGYDFWKRYLDVFETVTIAARMENVRCEQVAGYLRSDGDRVSFAPMPMVRGAKGYIEKFPSFIRMAKKTVSRETCAIVRFPSIPALFIDAFYKKRHRPYALEIVADPLSAYAENRLVAKLLAAHLDRKSVV